MCSSTAGVVDVVGVDEGVEVDGVVVDDVVGLLITGASAQGPLICSRGYKCPRSFIVTFTAFCHR